MGRLRKSNMKLKLVDSSVWIDYLKGTKGKIFDELDHHILEGSVAICPVILQEVLQGAKTDKEYNKVLDSFLGFEMLTLDGVLAAIGAANLYRTLKTKGITVRRPNDCLIAYYCIQFGIPILQLDRDFHHIARESPLQLYKL